MAFLSSLAAAPSNTLCATKNRQFLIEYSDRTAALKQTAPAVQACRNSVKLRLHAVTGHIARANYNAGKNGTLLDRAASVPFTEASDYRRRCLYNVRTSDPAGNVSNTSSSMTVGSKTDMRGPNRPTGLALHVFGGVQLSWNASADDVAGYNIYKNSVLIGHTVSTSFNDARGKNGDVYAVSAYDSSGNESLKSNSVTVGQ